MAKTKKVKACIVCAGDIVELNGKFQAVSESWVAPGSVRLIVYGKDGTIEHTFGHDEQVKVRPK
jgi:hypothetical protein